jgi:hypothetical protein
VFQDLRGGMLTEANVSNDAALFEVAACDLVHLRIDF